jgi:superfamily II DNA or RNA helicase
VKYSELFQNINLWTDFTSVLETLSKKEKGNAFELLTKLYFKLSPKYSFYDEVWMLSEVPTQVIEELGIPSHDLGIDLIAKSGDEYHAIQCKYHSDNKQSVTFKEVSTFISLLESTTKFTQGYICSSADFTSKNYNKLKTKPINLVLSDSWQELEQEFFENVRSYLAKKKVSLQPFKPRDHQKKALSEAVEYFVNEGNSRGKLIFPCGAGKSLTGFWMLQAFKSKSTLIAVPSLSLVKQTLDVYLREIVAHKRKVKWLCICSDEGIGQDDDVVFYTENLGVPCQTDPGYIEQWLKENKNEEIIVFTTYQSGRIIAEISKKLNYSFDLAIFDEAHKTVGSDKKLFSHLLFEENISIQKRIFMTATERFYRGSKDDIISMDDFDIYGDTFTQMSFKEAIELGLLTDYKVITIDVKKSEIADFIKQNNLVQLNNKWKKETEARSLASMLALRKAMKQFPIKNAVSFHSSIEKAVRNKELQQHITESYHYDPIDTFTVSGKLPTSKRNVIVQEFARSPKSLITNARCLTEGVDVPNIDCIVFSDPRKSKVDIVQALGRALRKKEGKDWGYVILPVIYDEETHDIDNENFQEILSVVRGLASNDERIVEYFKDKADPGSTKKTSERQFQLEVFSEFMDESELSNQLQIRLWDKLSRFSWMPFEEAREYVRGLNLTSSTEFTNYWRQGKLPKNIPSKPRVAYNNYGFISMPDFLGYDSLFQDWMTFEIAREFVRELGLKSEKDWESYAKSELRPLNLPKTPFNVYKNKGFISMPDFLGYDSKFQEWLDYDEALIFVQSLKLKSTNEWRKYTKSADYNVLIPKAPNNHYRNKGWVNFGTWLGTHVIADNLKKYYTYEEAKSFLKFKNLTSKEDFDKFKSQESFPGFIPKMPDIKYRKTGEWKGWPDFLSYTRKHKWDFLPFEQARGIVRNLNLKNSEDWRKYTKSDNFPKNIPKAPGLVYLEEWLGIGDWLGTGRIADHKKEFLSFEEARKLARSYNFIKMNEWKSFQYSKDFPINLPKSPDNVYKDKGWISWPDFLGYEKNEFYEFNEARKIVHSLKLKSQSQWYLYCKSSEFDPKLPKSPKSVYKKYWKNMGDWLGTNTIAPQNRVFLDFKSAKKLIKKLKIGNTDEWKKLRKLNLIPELIPSNPDKKYKDDGWNGWADFLGKDEK